jgi:putative endonuclease
MSKVHNSKRDDVNARTHFVYIIETKNNKFYAGYTIDLDRRMLQHKEGKGSKFIRAFGFKKLRYFESYTHKSDALKRELEIKGWTRAQKEKFLAGRQRIKVKMQLA